MKAVEDGNQTIKVFAGQRVSLVEGHSLDNIGLSRDLDVFLGEQFDEVDVLGVTDVDIGDGESGDSAGLVHVLFLFEVDGEGRVVNGGGALGNDEGVEEGSDGRAHSRAVCHYLSVADRIADVLLVYLV